MPRVLIVSNRLPVTVRRHAGGVDLVDSCGGLATALRGHHESQGGLWLGWPGDQTRPGAGASPVDDILLSRRLVPVHLTHEQVHRYYEGFSNGALWPLFHYLLDRMRFVDGDWRAYRDVNERFADSVATYCRPGDVVWVHDYHLMLLPALLRRRLPDVRIGFFLHIPFPSSELFRILPCREALLEGLLGADLIGFHTHAYVRHFVVALRHILGLQPEFDHVQWQDRRVRFADFPLGIDDVAFERLSADAGVQAETRRVRLEAGGRAILLGVDRLDYTKGIPRRLEAFERLLERTPNLHDRVRLIQVAVPSRDGVRAYEAFRRQVEETVGRINGRFGTTGAAPVHYLHRSLSRAQLVALYRSADVLLVTPVRDGMNLVAKEFIASRTDDDGVLVLSEFAGAASEMGEALLVNPYDPDAITAAMHRALEMSAPERATRMQKLRQRVKRQNLHRWTTTFLGALGASGHKDQPGIRLSAPADVASLAERLRREEELVLLLDYDGTLVPFTAVPDLAHPDAELLDLLHALASTSRAVHIVSGRGHATMERWFGHMPIDLWAEHGLWHRARDTRRWDVETTKPPDWFNQARTILDWFTARTPGSLVEAKATALAWHYRMSDPEMGDDHARHLRRTLTAALHRHPVEILDGKKVVEVRPRAASKGRVVDHILKQRARTPLILAVGDDRTDEDMFDALPPSAVSVHVGPGASRARHRLPDSQAVRSLVRGLLQ